MRHMGNEDGIFQCLVRPAFFIQDMCTCGGFYMAVMVAYGMKKFVRL